MPSFEILLTFFIGTAIFSFMPGPAMLYTGARTIARGRRAGWMAVLGIHVGGYVHVIAAALGLAILFETIPLLYALLKFAGAAYLVWLGVKLFLSNGMHTDFVGGTSVKSLRRAFWESITVEVLNPKTAMFYLAFLPQFTDASAALPMWAQFLILGTFVNAMFSSGDALCVLLAHKVTGALRASPVATALTQRLGGGILVALGVNLAVGHQSS